MNDKTIDKYLFKIFDNMVDDLFTSVGQDRRAQIKNAVADNGIAYLFVLDYKWDKETKDSFYKKYLNIFVSNGYTLKDSKEFMDDFMLNFGWEEK